MAYTKLFSAREDPRAASQAQFDRITKGSEMDPVRAQAASMMRAARNPTLAEAPSASRGARPMVAQDPALQAARAQAVGAMQAQAALQAGRGAEDWDLGTRNLRLAMEQREAQRVVQEAAKRRALLLMGLKGAAQVGGMLAGNPQAGQMASQGIDMVSDIDMATRPV